MGWNSRILLLKIFLMKSELSVNSLMHILLNKMEWLEARNHTLMEMMRTLLDKYKTPMRFWAKAVKTTCHVITCLYLHKLLEKTLYEFLTGKNPTLVTLEFLGPSVISMTNISNISFPLNLMRDTC